MTHTKSSSDEAQVKGVIALAQRLEEIVARETELFQQRRPSEVKDFEAEKIRLTAQYTKEIERLRRDPSGLKLISSGVREQLKSMTALLRKTLERHATVLEHLRHISEGMVKAVADEIATRKAPATGYAKNAALRGNAAVAPTPIAINQVI